MHLFFSIIHVYLEDWLSNVASYITFIKTNISSLQYDIFTFFANLWKYHVAQFDRGDSSLSSSVKYQVHNLSGGEAKMHLFYPLYMTFVYLEDWLSNVASYMKLIMTNISPFRDNNTAHTYHSWSTHSANRIRLISSVHLWRISNEKYKYDMLSWLSEKPR